MLKNLVLVLTSAAFGSLIGLISNPKTPCKSASIGAAMGFAAGATFSVVISSLKDDSIKYYGQTSGLYGGSEEDGII